MITETISNTIVVNKVQWRRYRNRWNNLRSRHGDHDIVKAWLLGDGQGLKNFIDWLSKEYAKIPLDDRGIYCIVKIRKSAKWSAANCKLVEKSEHLQGKTGERIPQETRDEIISLVSANPTMRLRELTKQFPYSLSALSNLIKKNIGSAKERKKKVQA